MSDAPDTRFADAAARHATAWLLVGCALGTVCAAGLLAPAFGSSGLPGYGRLMATHLDLQLYGWCFIPILALGVARLFRGDELSDKLAALGLWSAALAAGALHWFRGGAAGKVFLDWRGFSLAALVAALTLIWSLAARSAWRQRATAGNLARWAALAGLALSAAGFVRACDPAFLPPVNPHSGGATGHNLLASTLGFAGLVAMAVAVLFPAARAAGLRRNVMLATLALGGVTHLTISHGDASNHAPDQILGLSFTILPGLALAWWMAALPWRSREPLGWFAFWWFVTAADGLIIFLPGVLEHAKFSNALVAHAHWAMAGMVTALNLLLLENLPGARLRFGAASQRVWHLANWVMGAALTVHATRESDGVLWGGADGGTIAAYAVRLACGALMLAVATVWTANAFGIDLAATWRRRHSLWPVWLLASFGLCDLLTGIFLVTMPAQTLAWMGIPDAATTHAGLTGLVGVFVGVVGASYLAQARLLLTPGGLPAATALYWLSAALRLCVAAYGTAAILDGQLHPAWATVPLADATIALTQVALRRRILNPMTHA